MRKSTKKFLGWAHAALLLLMAVTFVVYIVVWLRHDSKCQDLGYNAGRVTVWGKYCEIRHYGKAIKNRGAK